jgi:heme O synthase-like polyprenyltransferase
MTETRDTRPYPLMVGMLAGPIAWSVQLVANYMLVEVACRGSFPPVRVLGLSGAALLVLGVTLLMALITLYAAYLSYRTRQQLGEEEEGRTRAEKRSAFMALSGVYLSVLFLALIVFSGIPALVLPPCG